MNSAENKNMEVLFIQIARGRTYSFDITKSVITIGRDKQSDIVLSDKSVSRRHAEIVREQDGYSITDVGSTNGTCVNSRRIAKQSLQKGDTLTLGNIELTFQGIEKKDKQQVEEETEEKTEKTKQGVVRSIKLPRVSSGKPTDSFDFPK